jgi:uncharacterized protein (TIGR03435 family)
VPDHFEVASLKLSTADPTGNFLTGGPGTPSPGQIVCKSFPLHALLMSIYRVKETEIIGPPWLKDRYYDITAKVPPGVTMTQTRVMIQNLLIDRLKMKMHREAREEPGYELSVAKGGLKMKDAAVSADGKTSIREEPGLGGLARVTGQSVSSSRIATFLMQRLLHWDHVVDRTGLTSNYDFKLEFVPENANDLPGPDLITALRQQLGLQLTPKKVSTEVIVIDSANEHPIEN